MRVRFLAFAGVLAGLALGLWPASAQEAGGSDIAIINIQDAILRSQEGQAMAQQLQQKYKPRQDELQQMGNEIQTLRDQLQRGANTMSEDAQRRLMREIQTKERDLQRASEDARAEFNEEQQQAVNQIGGKMMTVIDKYAKEKGFEIVLDVSAPQSPVLYAVNEVNITNNIVELYDKEYPTSASAAAGASATAAAAGR